MKQKTKLKKYLIAIVVILIFAACFIPPQNYNSKNKLNIVSPYGDNEAYHPKVITFKEKWNGYKYWMSYTPYPQGDDSKENPCIVASNDLITWETPKGLKNPIDIPEDTRPQTRYNSDSHILYNNILNRMECYWRYVDDIKNEAVIYRSYTENGVNWSNKEVAFIGKPRNKKDYVSLAILFENNIYKMWYVNKRNTLTYAESEDGKIWRNEQVIKLAYDEDVKTWHLDVIHTEKGYEMIAVAYKNWKLHNDMNLYYSMSKDGIKWTTATKIMEPTTKTENWDNRGIYRSSFVYENGIYYVFYSGTSKELHHGIGLMYGKDIHKLKKNGINYKNKKEVERLKQRINRETKI